MKTVAIGLLALVSVLSASAVEKAELDNRIRALTAKFEALQQQADNCVPAETLRKAQGIILLDRTKAGFIFAYQGGSGVAMVRNPKTHEWSPAAFLSANEASLGFQIGGEQNFFVILLMNTNATRMLTEPTFDVGGEARGTAGDSSSGVGTKFASSEPPVVVYNDRKGLYGGAAIKGGAITPDQEANSAYYGDYFTMKDILFDHKVKPTASAMHLAGKIEEFSKGSKR